MDRFGVRLAVMAIAAAIAGDVVARSPADVPARASAAQRPAQASASQCHRWQRVAERLGETFAGARLRRTVVAQACATEEAYVTGQRTWGWPWRSGSVAADLPPHLHGRYGAWTIRCGGAEPGDRCALIHEARANIEPGSGALGSIGIVTHFVIDEVGGEERLLWRVFAERADATWYSTSSGDSAAPPATGAVHIAAGSDVLIEPFDACAAPGCMMEAALEAGERVATRLSQGYHVDLAVRPSPGLALHQPVDANGFRAGLGELTRLKRREQTAVAGR